MTQIILIFKENGDTIENLAGGYKINKPILSGVTNYSMRQANKPSVKSFVWSDELVKREERISCQEGKLESGERSELCKYELLLEWIKTFQSIAKLESGQSYVKSTFQVDNCEQVQRLSYHEIKRVAKDYQAAKLQVYKPNRAFFNIKY